MAAAFAPEADLSTGAANIVIIDKSVTRTPSENCSIIFVSLMYLCPHIVSGPSVTLANLPGKGRRRPEILFRGSALLR